MAEPTTADDGPPAGAPDRGPDASAEDPAAFPGAQAPARRRDLVADGVRLAVHEWGAPDAPPLLLAHGGFDFARTFDVFAPMLASAGWRVVCWDQRGHGDSAHAHLYSWRADLRDAVAVLDSIGPDPIPLVGHSKGGSILLELADAMPWRVARLANLDGLPSSNNDQPDVQDHDRTKLLASEITAWLEHHRRAHDAVRRPGSIDELARRRGRMNPRLSAEWLRYLVTVGARHDDDGWRWKIDPALRLGGFGPWNPEWSMQRMPGLAMPFLGMLGDEPEEMGWATRPDDVLPHLPPGARLEVLAGAGHFLHIERPDEVAGVVLDFLGEPGTSAPWGPGADAAPRTAPTPLTSTEQPGMAPAVAAAVPASTARPEPEPGVVWLRHAKVDLALHELRAGEGRPLLLLHGLGERTPPRVPGEAAAWPGPVWGLDLTGHGRSTLPAGGGYTCELLMADADRAVEHLGTATVLGRGLGAYVALLLAGARPDAVRGAVLADGHGLAGGGVEPGSPVYERSAAGSAHGAPPDPHAVVELATDVRPPTYATSFARLAVQSSDLRTPLVVAARFRPPWLAAVAAEPGVAQAKTVEDALARLV